MVEVYPVSPGTVYDAMLEDWTCEENGHEEHGAEGVYGGNRPHAKQAENVHGRWVLLVEHDYGDDKA